MAAIIYSQIVILLLLWQHCSTQIITFVLQEDRPNGTLIGNILNESKLSKNYTPEQINGITFDFYEIAREQKPLFRLNTATSNLYTNTIIDRERYGICQYLTECYFDFKILAHKTSDIFEIIDTRVNVTDLNDNEPKFPTNEQVINISEATTQFTKIPIEGAKDLDTGKDNGVISYSLTSQSNTNDFRLVEETTVGEKKLSISIEHGLDRERTASYVLYLKAKDNGNPVRTGTLTIKINVIDENDNIPEFSESNVDVNIDEASLAGTLVKQLTAVDRDAGKNGEVFYRLKNFQHKEINDSFSIDNNGRLILAKKLEYEQGKVYTVIVEAVDKGSIPSSSQATIKVYVQDSGNNVPVISVNFLSNDREGDAVIISETSEINTLVAVIKVKDTDTGENGKVDCSTYSTYFGLSKISQTNYRLIVQHKLDRESMVSHNVTVTCRDNGQPKLDDSVHFKIILKDENDSPPQFSEYYYSGIQLQENLGTGYHFFTVTATDNDTGDNGKITYEISPITDPRFIVDPHNGEIRTNAVFDREATSQVIFEVVAKDNGNPQLMSKVSVVVDITDVNDNKPEFTKMIFYFQIAEGLPVGTAVNSVSAIDHDKGSNREFVFSFDPNHNTSTLPFTIFSTGEIKTSSELDREEHSHYNFPIIAVDKGSPPLTSTATVRITVTDKNDNKPIFTFPKSENNTITIPNTLRDESIIATIQAYDRDYEENGNVNFFILAGDIENAFYLNPTTGSLHIKMNAIIDATEDKYYKLKIEARDRGSPSHNTTGELNVVILHINATSLKLTESKEYILISVSIVCVTFVCAVGLIAVICFLKKKSISCGKGDRYSENNQPPQYDQVQMSSNNYPYSVQNDKNKQRVKLSEPGTTFTKQQMMENLTLTKKDSPRKDKEDNNYNFDRQKPLEESETSSKTDSGHGSEEDFNHPLDKNGRPYSQNNHHTVPTYNNSSGIYVMLDKNKTKDIPRSNNILDRLPSREISNKYLDDSCLTASLNSMWSDPNPSSSRLPSLSQTSTHSPSWSNDFKLNLQNNSSPFYMALSSIQSRDDDGSTTTSGSYTINPDELDDDFPNRPKDLFV